MIPQILCIAHIIIGLYAANAGRVQKDYILLSVGLLLSLYHLYMLFFMRESFTLSCSRDRTQLSHCDINQDDTPHQRTDEEQAEKLKELIH